MAAKNKIQKNLHAKDSKVAAQRVAARAALQAKFDQRTLNAGLAVPVVDISLTSAARWQLLALVLVLGVLIYHLAPILTPFATAALFAYLGDPAADSLEKRGFSRSLSVALVFCAILLSMVAIVLILVPLIEQQVSKLFEKLPVYIETVRTKFLPWLQQRFGINPDLLDVDRLIAMLREHWRSAGGVAATVLATVGKSGLTLLGWVVNLTLIPVLLFYFLRDWDVMTQRVRTLLPRHLEPTISALARQSDEVLSAFLRGQMSVMLALGTIYSAGLWLVGLDLALLIGMGAGMVSFIPYLGGIVGVVVGLIAAYMQFHDWFHPAMVLLVFGVGQSLEGMVLTPLLVGDKIGMHPVAVIFAIMAGGQLFGFLGVLLALPVAAIVMVLLRFLHARYLKSALYCEGESSVRDKSDAPNPSDAQPLTQD
jgi:predicted PurR-regulated permease PerM